MLPDCLLCNLSCVGIRSRCLCAQGDLVGAVAVARRGLVASQHDSLASFLHLQGGVPGAHMALMGLQGLSLEMEAELCMATGRLPADLDVCDCLLCMHDVRSRANSLDISLCLWEKGTCDAAVYLQQSAA